MHVCKKNLTAKFYVCMPKSTHFTYILNIDIDIAIFCKYLIDIVSKLKTWYRSSTTVDDYYYAKFQVIPIRGFPFIALTYTPTHTHTHTHHDKVIAISAPPYYVFGMDVWISLLLLSCLRDCVVRRALAWRSQHYTDRKQ